MVHKLKTDAECFRDFELGYKTFETRQQTINKLTTCYYCKVLIEQHKNTLVFASIACIFGRKEHEKEFVKKTM